MKEWQHDELAADLAGHLRSDARMTWEDLQLGPAGSPRPDVYTLMKSFSKPKPTVYEVKISRSDFRSDVTSGKWQSYLPYAERVVFAVPRGLVTKAEVPSHCGLLVRGDKGWRAVKRATANPVTVPQDALLKLLIDGVHREGACKPEDARAWRAQRAAASRFGEEIARQLADVTYATRAKAALDASLDVERKRRRAQLERETQLAWEQAPQAWTDLCNALELPVNTASYHVTQAVRRVREASSDSVAAPLLRARLRRLQTLVDSIADLLPPEIK